MNPRQNAILQYWFGDLEQTPAWFEKRNRLWFGGAPEVDEFILINFETDLIAAVEGRLQNWGDSPRGCLALIILLDQFSLNLYREQPRSYDQSRLAIPLVQKVLSKNWDWVFTPAEKVFLYLPLEHSESISDQRQAVSLYEQLARSAPQEYQDLMGTYLEYADRHFKVVHRFGRFPDRNEVYGRASTSDELQFLASNEAPF